MISNDKITENFCAVDDFCKEIKQILDENSLESDSSVKKRKRKCKLSDSDVISIMVFFHLKGYRCLKHFYIHYVQKHMQSEFPETVSYNRFVELQSKSILPMVDFPVLAMPLNTLLV
jgi:ribosome-associated protein YbcJ (S4-like RNA binding protein)